MAFCNNCGAELPEGGKFCTKCGTKVEIVPVPESMAAPVEPAIQENIQNQPVQNMPVYEMPQGMPQNNPYDAPQQSPYGAPQQAATKEKKPVNKKLIIIIAAAVLAFIILIIVIAVVANIIKTKKEIEAKTIKFNEDFLEVEYSGYDGYGEATIYIDREEFKPVVYEAMGYDEDSKSSKAEDKFLDLIYGIDLEISDKKSLSNKQEITVKVVADEEVLEDVDVIMKEVEITLTVNGLTEVIKYNPFDDITVSTSGMDGNVDVTLDYIGNVSKNLSKYSFSIDNSYNLSVGDSFTVSLDSYYTEYLLSYEGIVITETEKTYKVEKADHYIYKYEDISEETFNNMKSDASDAIIDYYADSYFDEELDSHEYYGAYVMKGIRDSWSVSENVVYIIYECVVSSTEDAYEPITVYVPVKFTNLKEFVNGTQEYSEWYSVGSNSEVVEGTYEYVHGYFTEKDLFNDFYDAKDYEYEFIGKVKDFSKVTDEPDEEPTEEEEKETVEKETAEDETVEGEESTDEVTEEETTEEETTEEETTEE